ncbi:MAG TPA: GNAT family N-acetyltransferase, partial [Balneolaceae bacterium]|nr:GNAT family N-acetyltransferase [Balneolaceae bacterium]
GLCTGMMYDPSHPNNKPKAEREKTVNKYYRWVKLKTVKYLKKINPINAFLSL